VPISEIDGLHTIIVGDSEQRRWYRSRARAKRDCWQLLTIRLSVRLNKEGYQRWQNIPASVFVVRFEWKHLGNRKPWVIVIADHAVRGQVDRSMPSASGSQMP
jgi:hypothetical protein